MSEEINCLFVYGSLAPNCVNAHILKPLRGEFKKGWVRGQLCQQGWGADMGYPGIELNSQAQWVEGYVFLSQQLGDHWSMLDAFEGEEYSRQVCEVKMENAEYCKAYIYTLSK
ncbi:gamma-glutamylcyclotransferase family protein [Pseudoalteromonas luteoviolacea]|uniref:Gamma-glutamylcyclotransferase AIG2-like domain-containing protein n=1 Tax=Pseudoalteromonas luteoviolacea (strain 2ta16) TaxID=1353533 RepID=V4H6Q7_PSEL2|nr:gamma-glutamylcyclotransferase family protein [Pseudoalteromonas luteoviolacea]ESP93181.1 hypothetical protein PL2TA16_03402 [Pseudoalteromonas luteoviolacea 2ta16]KZN37053.1 hypothetical protein N483_21650 [Pseudoalteromonas luteoviolacea NCIMB 1944]